MNNKPPVQSGEVFNKNLAGTQAIIIGYLPEHKLVWFEVPGDEDTYYMIWLKFKYKYTKSKEGIRQKIYRGNNVAK